MTDKDRYELKIAGLLHDCGKVTTPVHVVDKATKLQTIFDRIGLIDTRFEVLKRDAEIRMLRAKLEALRARRRRRLAASWKRDCQRADRSSSTTTASSCASATSAASAWRPRTSSACADIGDGVPLARRRMATEDAPFLTDEEIKNLTIRSGTLTAEERQIINHHIEVTIKMLEALPWPRHLKNVPEYAGGHHERMDGKGYPRGLTREQMSVQARCMGIADIFEALTAKDRPYKKGKTLTEALTILGKFKLNGHIDPDLFDIFMWKKVY